MLDFAQSTSVASAVTAVTITWSTPRFMYRIRSWLGPGSIVQGGLGGWWPTTTGQIGMSPRSARVLCVGPTEWLVVGEAVEVQRLSASPFCAVHVGEGLAQMCVVGDAALALLASFSALDFENFAAGTCARTRFSNVVAVVERSAAAQFMFYFPRSYQQYLIACIHEVGLGKIEQRFEP